MTSESLPRNAGDYALAQCFPSRAAKTYEDRVQSFARDITDGPSPGACRKLRRALLELHQRFKDVGESEDGEHAKSEEKGKSMVEKVIETGGKTEGRVKDPRQDGLSQTLKSRSRRVLAPVLPMLSVLPHSSPPYLVPSALYSADHSHHPLFIPGP